MARLAYYIFSCHDASGHPNEPYVAGSDAGGAPIYVSYFEHVAPVSA